jgi:hypothetical protein
VYKELEEKERTHNLFFISTTLLMHLLPIFQIDHSLPIVCLLLTIDAIVACT